METSRVLLTITYWLKYARNGHHRIKGMKRNDVGNFPSITVPLFPLLFQFLLLYLSLHFSPPPPMYLLFSTLLLLPLYLSLSTLRTSLQGTVTVTSILTISKALSVDGGLYFCEAHNNLPNLSNTVQSKQAEISVKSRHCGREGERLRRMGSGKKEV